MNVNQVNKLIVQMPGSRKVKVALTIHSADFTKNLAVFAEVESVGLDVTKEKGDVWLSATVIDEDGHIFGHKNES